MKTTYVKTIRVEVAVARDKRLLALELPADARVIDALQVAGMAPGTFAGIALHGQLARVDAPLRDGDRIELLEPLQADPKEVRRRRAAARRG